MDKEFLVSVDDLFEEILSCAIRYACGRKTYVVKDVSDYTCNLIPYLSDRTLNIIIKDIDDQKQFFGLGDACDESCWLQLQNRCKEELEQRVATNTHRLVGNNWYNKLP
jgi:hypothetical protein